MCGGGGFDFCGLDCEMRRFDVWRDITVSIPDVTGSLCPIIWNCKSTPVFEVRACFDF